MIEIRDLRVTRGKREVVHGVSLDVPAGSWVSIVGPNGAGKSSMLLAVAALLPAAGDVAIGGRPVRDLRARERARLVALVPQQPVIPDALTVAEYVLLGRTPHLSMFGSEAGRDHELADRILAKVDLAWAADRLVPTLSGGEFHRAVVGRALAQEARVLLLDEPTSGLDLGHQVQVLELVDALRRSDGITVVSAMHDLTLAARYADRVALLVEGELVAEGSPDDVFRPELLERHYGVPVHVLRGPGGELIVAPADATRVR
jgi:ABC-type cobalamin/Fe3+-siderophores transport system ATPase subunit